MIAKSHAELSYSQSKKEQRIANRFVFEDNANFVTIEDFI